MAGRRCIGLIACLGRAQLEAAVCRSYLLLEEEWLQCFLLSLNESSLGQEISVPGR